MNNTQASHDGQAAGRDIINDNSTKVINISVEASLVEPAIRQNDSHVFPEQSRWIARLMQLEEAKRLEAEEYSRRHYGTGMFKSLGRDQLLDVIKEFDDKRKTKCENCIQKDETIKKLTELNEGLNKKLISAYVFCVLMITIAMSYIIVLK